MRPKPRVGFFPPCFVDQYAPAAAWAAVAVLEHLGVEVVIPEATPPCCGQALTSAGWPQDTRDIPGRLARAMDGVDAIIVLSASCASFCESEHPHLARAADWLAIEQRPPVHEWASYVASRLAPLAPAHPGERVGLHVGCHDAEGAARRLLRDFEVVEPERNECCGFGGVFVWMERAVSVRMGRDKLAGFSGCSVVVSADMSCLLHLESLRSHQKPETDGIGPQFLSLPEFVADRLQLRRRVDP